ncbi:MAG: alpha/beta hydrolase [Caulobacter sp.]|nr:alpha/beta hydrolase [Caulobacter sp.]
MVAMRKARVPASGKTPAPRGRMVDIGGRRLHAIEEAACGAAARRTPHVILEAGAFGLSADWAVVQEKLSRAGYASTAYDRAGLGTSDPGPTPRDSDAIVGDLEALIEHGGLKGPFILAGHSMAGLHVRLFAVRHPQQTAGLVLVDATTPEVAAHPVAQTFINRFGTISGLAAAGAGAGLLRPLMGTSLGDTIGLPPDASGEKRRAFASAMHNRWSADEARQWLADSRLVEEAGPLAPELPVAVVTAGPVKGREAWKAFQSAPAHAAHHGQVENVPRAGHATLLGPRFADAIVRGVIFVDEASSK